jgi:hypothetical protein
MTQDEKHLCRLLISIKFVNLRGWGGGALKET